MTEGTLTDREETVVKFVRVMDWMTEMLYPEYTEII